MDSFIDGLPKLELHVHIEGTLSPSLRWRLAQRNKISLPQSTYEQLVASYAVTYNHRKDTRGDNGNPTFFEAYYGGMEVLRTEEDFYELAMEYFAKAKAMNVRYAEVFFDPQAHSRRGVSLHDVVNGLQRAREDAKQEFGVHSNWIMCFLRDVSPDSAMEHYNAIKKDHADAFVAIGLDSNEFDRPPSLFEELFQRARHDGYKLTCHCDVYQKDTHDHIHQVLCTVGTTGADRIDHGINAADMPELTELLVQRGIGMTLCPHAYVRHEPPDKIYPAIRLLYDRGAKITVNSDDPTYMHENWVLENLKKVQKGCQFDRNDMIRLQKNAVEVCWANDDLKKLILEELESYQANN